jgi:hypothetical protein
MKRTFRQVRDKAVADKPKIEEPRLAAASHDVAVASVWQLAGVAHAVPTASWSSVVLPAPLGPNNAVTDPASTAICAKRGSSDPRNAGGADDVGEQCRQVLVVEARLMGACHPALQRRAQGGDRRKAYRTCCTDSWGCRSACRLTRRTSSAGPESQAPSPCQRAGGPHGGHHLARHQPARSRHRIDDLEPAPDPVRSVDDDR